MSVKQKLTECKDELRHVAQQAGKDGNYEAMGVYDLASLYVTMALDVLEKRAAEVLDRGDGPEKYKTNGVYNATDAIGYAAGRIKE